MMDVGVKPLASELEKIIDGWAIKDNKIISTIDPSIEIDKYKKYETVGKLNDVLAVQKDNDWIFMVKNDPQIYHLKKYFGCGYHLITNEKDYRIFRGDGKVSEKVVGEIKDKKIENGIFYGILREGKRDVIGKWNGEWTFSKPHEYVWPMVVDEGIVYMVASDGKHTRFISWDGKREKKSKDIPGIFYDIQVKNGILYAKIIDLERIAFAMWDGKDIKISDWYEEHSWDVDWHADNRGRVFGIYRKDSKKYAAVIDLNKNKTIMKELEKLDTVCCILDGVLSANGKTYWMINSGKKITVVLDDKVTIYDGEIEVEIPKTPMI